MSSGRRSRNQNYGVRRQSEAATPLFFKPTFTLVKAPSPLRSAGALRKYNWLSWSIHFAAVEGG